MGPAAQAGHAPNLGPHTKGRELRLCFAMFCLSDCPKSFPGTPSFEGNDKGGSGISAA